MTTGEPLLRVENLTKHFGVRQGLTRRETGTIRAVDGVSFDVIQGETLGIVGESGCGKSTLARCLIRLQEVTDGRIEFEGQDITHLSARRMRPLRKDLMMVFQDPYGSLNPRLRIGSTIAEPMQIHGSLTAAEVKRSVESLLERVGLRADHYDRFPHEFSGGQRQRIGIARALAVNPKLIVCDEPVSALDTSVQAQIINLLKDLQNEFGLTYIFIAHDLNVVRHVSDRVLVMYLGKVVEQAKKTDLYLRPRHPYTVSLLSAVPAADPGTARERRQVLLEGEVPSPLHPPSGCSFHPRCPRAQAECATQMPAARTFDEQHFASCHHPIEQLALVSVDRPRAPGDASSNPL